MFCDSFPQLTAGLRGCAYYYQHLSGLAVSLGCTICYPLASQQNKHGLRIVADHSISFHNSEMEWSQFDANDCNSLTWYNIFQICITLPNYQVNVFVVVVAVSRCLAYFLYSFYGVTIYISYSVFSCMTSTLHKFVSWQNSTRCRECVKYCGVVLILFGWFLRVSFLHVLVFLQKTFCHFIIKPNHTPKMLIRGWCCRLTLVWTL